jgi:hypothetical protein
MGRGGPCYEDAAADAGCSDAGSNWIGRSAGGVSPQYETFGTWCVNELLWIRNGQLPTRKRNSCSRIDTGPVKRMAATGAVSTVV